MPTGGSAAEQRSRAAKWRRAARSALRPAFGLTVITPLVFAGAVGATPRSPSTSLPLRNAAVTPLAAAMNTSSDRSSGPSVVAIQRPPANLHVVAGAPSAPPAAVVYAPGTLGIPKTALAAYRNAEQQMSVAAPGCGISWNLLAGIGRIESRHANGGATDLHGTVLQPIYGPSLDGSLPGNEVIVASSAPGRVVYARAIGPMQFLPGTWSRYAADGDGDGRADPQNVYDATLAAARYLCSGGLNLREQPQVLTAILRYNNSMAYAENVMGWAAAYATGVAPVDLPPIVGPAPPIADRHLEHLEHPEGLGPESGSPLNFHGLSGADPTAGASLIDLGQFGYDDQATQTPSWLPSWLPSWMTPAQQQPRPSAACRMICLEPPAGTTPAAPPYAVPPAPNGFPAMPFAPPEAPPAPPAPMPAYAVAPAPLVPPDNLAALPPQAALALPPQAAFAAPPQAPQASPQT